MLDLTVPHDLTEHERDAILAHFKTLPEDMQTRSRTFELCLPDRPPLFIKHGTDVLNEAYTQHFFYRLPRNDPRAPRIPRVFDAFQADGYRFFVMAKIDAPTLEDAGIDKEEAVEHAARAVKWLIDQTPFVPSFVFGRVSAKDVPVWHKFFKDQEAPRAFDPDMLLRYVKKAFRCRPGRHLDPTLETELDAAFQTRSVCHSDINTRNFLVDAHGDVWLVDFQHVSVLPIVFRTYAFFNTGDRFAKAVGKRLGYQSSTVSNAMVAASVILYQTGGCAKLGECSTSPIKPRASSYSTAGF